jgi:hypothetical protein
LAIVTADHRHGWWDRRTNDVAWEPNSLHYSTCDELFPLGVGAEPIGAEPIGGEAVTADHLTVTTSDRGFRYLPVIRGEYGDEWVRVYESSAASGPHVWLRVREDEPVHLTVENAVKLAEQLQFLVANHYQGPTNG